MHFEKLKTKMKKGKKKPVSPKMKIKKAISIKEVVPAKQPISFVRQNGPLPTPHTVNTFLQQAHSGKGGLSLGNSRQWRESTEIKQIT